MKQVYCLEDQRTYYFTATSGYDAILKMLYTLNTGKFDPHARIRKLNYTWSLEHGGNTYGSLINQ